MPQLDPLRAQIIFDVDKQKLNKAKILARDTKKELDKGFLVKLQLNTLELEDQLKKVKLLLKSKDLTTPERINLRLRQEELKSGLTEAKRRLRNYRNTGEVELSRLQAKFNSIGKSIFSGLINPTTAAIASFALFGRSVKKAISNFREFDKIQRQVQSISGASGASAEQMAKLESEAKRLGETTRFTATEISELQLELTKLGFTSDEVVALTGDVSNLAAAFNTELGTTATSVGATLKIFGKDASEAGAVSDIMAKAFANSALDLSKFSTAIVDAGPIAKTFGFSLEETTALLGVLSDAGFDASKAGTATRNILLSLADSGGALAQALGEPVKTLPDLVTGLKKLKSEGIDLAGTLELTDKRSVAAFNRFIEGADSITNLNEKLQQAGGTAQKLADEQLVGLNGSLTLMESAIDGFGNKVGAFLAPAIIAFADFATAFLTAEGAVGGAVTGLGILLTGLALFFGGPLTLAIGVVTALSAAFLTLRGIFAGTIAPAEELNASLQTNITNMKKLQAEIDILNEKRKSGSELTAEETQRLSELNSELGITSENIKQLSSDMSDAEGPNKDLADAAAELSKAQELVNGSLASFIISGDDAAKILEEAQEKFNLAEFEALKYSIGVEDAANKQELLEKGLQKVNTAFDQVSTASTQEELRAIQLETIKTIKGLILLQQQVIDTEKTSAFGGNQGDAASFLSPASIAAQKNISDLRSSFALFESEVQSRSKAINAIVETSEDNKTKDVKKGTAARTKIVDEAAEEQKRILEEETKFEEDLLDQKVEQYENAYDAIGDAIKSKEKAIDDFTKEIDKSIQAITKIDEKIDSVGQTAEEKLLERFVEINEQLQDGSLGQFDRFQLQEERRAIEKETTGDQRAGALAATDQTETESIVAERDAEIAKLEEKRALEQQRNEELAAQRNIEIEGLQALRALEAELTQQAIEATQGEFEAKGLAAKKFGETLDELLVKRKELIALSGAQTLSGEGALAGVATTTIDQSVIKVLISDVTIRENADFDLLSQRIIRDINNAKSGA